MPKATIPDFGVAEAQRRESSILGGVEGDHFLVCPPMITTAEQVGEITTILDGTLEQLATELNLPMHG